jgi:hypothetical protein
VRQPPLLVTEERESLGRFRSNCLEKRDSFVILSFMGALFSGNLIAKSCSVNTSRYFIKVGQVLMLVLSS